MGNQITAITKAINCEVCAKYVCNSMRVHSKCSKCCDLSIETQEVEIKSDNDSEDIEFTGCCTYHKST